MKSILNRATVLLVVLGIAGLLGSAIAAVYMQRNRDAREVAYASVVAAEKEELANLKKQQAALDAEAAEHPGTIARMALMGNTSGLETRRTIDSFDITYYCFARWQTIADAIAACSFSLGIFTSTARELIRRREART